MKKLLYVLLFNFIFSLTACAGSGFASEDTLFQASTIDALLEGYYDGFVSVADLKEKGDFGIGTVNALDGELIVVDGRFFHIKVDGNAYELFDNDTSPFAAVTSFSAEENFAVKDSLLLPELYSFIDSKLVSDNVFTAVKVKGSFKKITVRSVPKQEKPYKKLKAIVKTGQKVYEYENVTGTIVGFKSPSWVTKIGVPGYHFHFIDSEFKFGGHLLGLETDVIDVSTMTVHGFELSLPKTNVFYSLDLSEDKKEALKMVETKK